MGEAFQVSRSRPGINLQSSDCNELLGSRLTSNPRAVSCITARQSPGAFGLALPISTLHTDLNGTYRARASSAHSANKQAPEKKAKALRAASGETAGTAQK